MEDLIIASDVLENCTEQNSNFLPRILFNQFFDLYIIPFELEHVWEQDTMLQLSAVLDIPFDVDLRLHN